MKKFLLFLSCFLTTWCSVQAANPQINSVTYNESSSTFSVSYTSNSSNNSVWMISQATGPVGSRVTLGSSPATVDLPITARDGEYNLILYVNGSPCYQKSVTVTKYGHINSAKASSTSKVTVNYSMFHSKSDNFPEKSYLRIVGVANTTHEISNVKNGSYTWTGLNLTAGKTYTCEIYVDDKCLHTYTFKVPIPPVVNPTGAVNDVVPFVPSYNSVTVDYTLKDAQNATMTLYDEYNNKMKSLSITNSSTSKRVVINNVSIAENRSYTIEISANGANGGKFSTRFPFYTRVTDKTKINGVAYENNKIRVDFTLKNSGVNVAFQLISTKTGRTYYTNWGYCGSSSGSAYLSVPSESGSNLYVILLMENGQVKDDKQIMIAR